MATTTVGVRSSILLFLFPTQVCVSDCVCVCVCMCIHKISVELWMWEGKGSVLGQDSKHLLQM